MFLILKNLPDWSIKKIILCYQNYSLSIKIEKSKIILCNQCYLFFSINSIFLLLSLPWSGVDFVPCFLIRLCSPRSVKSVSSLGVGLVYPELSRGCCHLWSEPLSITALKSRDSLAFFPTSFIFCFLSLANRIVCDWTNSASQEVKKSVVEIIMFYR